MMMSYNLKQNPTANMSHQIEPLFPQDTALALVSDKIGLDMFVQVLGMSE